jgi:hypothetical protein
MRESPDVQENIESEECPSPSDHDPGSDVSPTPMQKNSRKNKAFKQVPPLSY